MRDHEWLEEQLGFLLSKYFSGVALTNPIEIRWGREARFRFGSIKLVSYKSILRRSTGSTGSTKGIRRVLSKFPVSGQNPKKSVVTVTSMFKDEKIPAGVVQYTIAHELCHYAHGFSSMNKQMFRHPHHGGVINRELTERGAQDLIPIFKKWLKGYRAEILAGRRKF